MAETLDMTASYAPSPDAMASRLGDETVILHLSRGTYFGLDAVGTVVWDALDKGVCATPSQVCAHVRSIFADAPDTVNADVISFLTLLTENDLILRK